MEKVLTQDNNLIDYNLIDNNECIICLDPLKNISGAGFWNCPQCNIHIHNKCYNNYGQLNCPHCRYDIPDTIITYSGDYTHEPGNTNIDISRVDTKSSLELYCYIFSACFIMSCSIILYVAFMVFIIEPILRDGFYYNISSTQSYI